MNRWLESIRRTHQLTIFAGSSMLGGSWGPVFVRALSEFNRLSRLHSLGVVFVQSAQPPDAKLTGANVHIEAIDGSATFQSIHGPQTMVLPANGFGGAKTRPIPSANGPIAQSLIGVPRNPVVMAGGGKSREAGAPIRLALTIHELIHACGLNNSEHTSFGRPDVFVPALTDRPGATPDDDRSEAGSAVLPPIFLTPETAVKIQALWLIPNPIIHFPRMF